MFYCSEMKQFIFWESFNSSNYNLPWSYLYVTQFPWDMASVVVLVNFKSSIKFTGLWQLLSGIPFTLQQLMSNKKPTASHHSKLRNSIAQSKYPSISLVPRQVLYKNVCLNRSGANIVNFEEWFVLPVPKIALRLGNIFSLIF